LKFIIFFVIIYKYFVYADVAELADAPDSKSKWIFFVLKLINIENSNV